MKFLDDFYIVEIFYTLFLIYFGVIAFLGIFYDYETLKWITWATILFYLIMKFYSTICYRGTRK